jgi:hypothetical protein
MRAFEIHTYQGGRWRIDSIFDDRDLAVFEAERMDVSGRYPGVRVVEEVYDEASNTTTSRTVYRGAKVAKANEENLKKSAEIRQQATLAREERQNMNAAHKVQVKRRTIQKKTSPARLIIIMILLAAFGGGAMFALSYLDKMM